MHWLVASTDGKREIIEIRDIWDSKFGQMFHFLHLHLVIFPCFSVIKTICNIECLIIWFDLLLRGNFSLVHILVNISYIHERKYIFLVFFSSHIELM